MDANAHWSLQPGMICMSESDRMAILAFNHLDGFDGFILL